jgi:hypothetical protein
MPSEKPDQSSTLALVGVSTMDVAQIMQVLAQYPLAQIKDANGNYRISNQKWIKYDAENRPIRVVTADGTKSDH